jgi:eukaryotic-like serine/threonine-protein kinase
MMTEAEIADKARLLLGVSFTADLQKGGQKIVQLVDRGGVPLVLKIVVLGTSRPDSLARAEREVELLVSLNSDNVVRVVSSLVTVGDPAVAAAWLEEYLDGDDLQDHLFTKQWTWDETATMAIGVARGLRAAHERPVVHRDLSAKNVRRLSDGTYKVMDFGFARFTLRSALTLAGQPGTPGYASPEHLQGYSGSPTPASDVFAVGILMYAALTARLPIPYVGDDADYLHRLSRVQIDSLSSLRSDLTPEQVSLVMRCLHRQPARRYLNGSKLSEALEEMQ